TTCEWALLFSSSTTRAAQLGSRFAARVACRAALPQPPRRRSKRLLGSADKPSRPSTVEDRPADLVSQPLILQDEFAHHIRELFALPTALEPAGALTLPSQGRRTHGLDRVGRSTKLVCGDMRHHCRLAGSKCGVP